MCARTSVSILKLPLMIYSFYFSVRPRHLDHDADPVRDVVAVGNLRSLSFRPSLKNGRMGEALRKGG